MPGTINNQQTETRVNFDGKRDAQAHNYIDDQASSSYYRDTGLLVIPIAGPSGTPPLIIQVHSPYGQRIERFQMAKKNTPPVVPSPEPTTSSGDILLNANLNFMQPRIRDQQNNLVYSTKGSYTYIQASVRDENSYYPTQKYIHVVPEINPKFDQGDNGYYENPTFLDVGIGGIVGGALAAVAALKNLTPESIVNNIADTAANINRNFTVQTTTYFPTFFKPDAIV